MTRIQSLKAVPALMLVLLSAVGCARTQPIQYQIDTIYSVHDPAFLRNLAGLTGAAFQEGNQVRTYSNGDEIFPAMLEAIKTANNSITFEIYSYEKGAIGKVFADALAERARAGVHVSLLADAVGAATMDPAWGDQMKAAGVQFYVYHPFDPLDPSTYPKTDHRTHRKILVIDGRVGFIGGVGIGDEWTGHAQDAAHWRDNVYQVTGPVVAQLQSAFADNWMETTGVVLQGPEYFPPVQAVHPDGPVAQVFRNSAAGGSQTMQLLVLLSIAGARQHVRLETPYFVPDGQTERALLNARRRGVSVEVIVPGKNIDVEIVRDASRGRWGRLLQAGVEIFEYQPTMLHSKLLVVDDLWTSIGSSNLDNRSFDLNAEANLNVLDVRFATQQIAIFETDKGKSRRITYSAWAHRPFAEKLQNALAEIIEPEL